jgi:endonuclease/exonuclease/phosphatase family metal-dependent hydrolase
VSFDAHEMDDPALEPWRANVGAPAALDLAAAPATPPRIVVAVTWNVWIGRGRIVDLVRRIRGGEFAALGAAADAPLILLLQEAYRSGDVVPAAGGAATGHGLGRGFGAGEDVVAAARLLGMSLRYAPSMRNASHRSDRGNAVLASLPLGEARAIELPLVRQRRVAVRAAVHLGGGRTLVAASAHLEPRGRAGRDWLGVGGRARQAERLAAALGEAARGEAARAPQLLGADLNLARGRREPAWAALEAAGFSLGLPPRVPLWPHTFHAMPRLVLDYLLVQDPDARAVAGVDVHRLDEDPRDRGPTVFGSDHHPLLAVVRLTDPD